MSLPDAVTTAAKLRDALAAEVEAARGERRLLRGLDSAALVARANARGAFLSASQRLQEDLARAIRAAAGALGVEATAEAIARAAPRDGALLARTVVEAVSPAPRAYDRRGVRARAGAPALAVVSTRG
jgi:hypothetical protein